MFYKESIKSKKAKEDRRDYWVSETGTLPIISQCATCAHKKEGDICEAYPDGIPQEILTNEVDHKKPYFGDHGIQYTHD